MQASGTTLPIVYDQSGHLPIIRGLLFPGCTGRLSAGYLQSPIRFASDSIAKTMQLTSLAIASRTGTAG